jgi:hypothetical protein
VLAHIVARIGFTLENREALQDGTDADARALSKAAGLVLDLEGAVLSVCRFVMTARAA